MNFRHTDVRRNVSKFQVQAIRIGTANEAIAWFVMVTYGWRRLACR
jgi:hypothetical protein